MSANKNEISVGFNDALVLAWFSGKSQANAKDALAAIRRSCLQGFWEKGMSRKAHAALTKANVAAKSWKVAGSFYEAAEYIWDTEHRTTGSTAPNCPKHAWSTIKRALMFGSGLDHALTAVEILEAQPAAEAVAQLPQIETRTGYRDGTLDDRASLLDLTERFCNALAPVWEAVKLLDSRRPPRVLVMGTLSPTVTATFGATALRLDMETIREVPSEVRWVQVTLKDGTKAMQQTRVLVYPKGTRFNKSRFHCTQKNWQCQACGHAIKNAMNWVPFLIDNADGIPHAFLVGTDCARNLFGCTIEGETAFENLLPEGI